MSMSEQERENSGCASARADGKPSGRCLVLAPREGGVSGELLAALSHRGLAVHLVGDEPGVMAELAGGDCAVVVAVDPSAWPRLAELAYAIRQHYPRVHCWQFVVSQGKGPRLTKLENEYLGPRPPREHAGGEATGHAATEDGSAIDNAAGDPRYGTPDGSAVGPIGRIRGRRRLIDKIVVRAPQAPSPTGSLVTEEELTMLLGPNPGEAG